MKRRELLIGSAALAVASTLAKPAIAKSETLVGITRDYDEWYESVMAAMTTSNAGLMSGSFNPVFTKGMRDYPYYMLGPVGSINGTTIEAKTRRLRTVYSFSTIPDEKALGDAYWASADIDGEIHTELSMNPGKQMALLNVSRAVVVNPISFAPVMAFMIRYGLVG